MPARHCQELSKGTESETFVNPLGCHSALQGLLPAVRDTLSRRQGEEKLLRPSRRGRRVFSGSFPASLLLSPPENPRKEIFCPRREVGQLQNPARPPPSDEVSQFLPRAVIFHIPLFQTIREAKIFRNMEPRPDSLSKCCGTHANSFGGNPDYVANQSRRPGTSA